MRPVRDIIAHVLLMGLHAYPTPEDQADALLKRLDHEGYEIVPKGVGDDQMETQAHHAVR
jgi:hypothetical protein